MAAITWIEIELSADFMRLPSNNANYHVENVYELKTLTGVRIVTFTDS